MKMASSGPCNIQNQIQKQTLGILVMECHVVVEGFSGEICHVMEITVAGSESNPDMGFLTPESESSPDMGLLVLILESESNPDMGLSTLENESSPDLETLDT